jgi:predicted PurR-regulated permease PerM
LTSIHEKQRVINRAVLTTIAGVIGVYFLYLLWNVVLVLYVSLVLEVGFSPAVHWIERQRFSERRLRVPRWLAILTRCDRSGCPPIPAIDWPRR